MTNHAMEVLFLTSYTEGCFQSIPAVAQLADDFAMRLTLVHVVDPKREHRSSEEARLASFFPEADRFAHTRRVVLTGDVAPAVSTYCERAGIDLVIAPGTPRGGLLHLGTSIRTKLIATSGVPVWTIGARARPSHVRRPPRRIGCWLAPTARDQGYLRLAARLADSMGGELHVLHVLPEVHEGEILSPRTPLHTSEVESTVAREIRGHDVPLHVHVSPGRQLGAMLDLVRSCEPDLLVLSQEHSVRWSLTGKRVGRLIDRIVGPVVCVGDDARVPLIVPGHGRTVRAPESLRSARVLQ